MANIGKERTQRVSRPYAAGVSALAPPYSARRLVLQLANAAVHHPTRITHRVTSRNLHTWQQFRGRTMHCNLCGNEGPIYFEWPDLGRHETHHIGVLRETLRCTHCHSRMRDRAIAAGLLSLLGDRYGVTATSIADLVGRLPDGMRILDTDADSRMSRLLASTPGFSRSLFLPGERNGEFVRDGIINADLQDMPFADHYFDVIITSDVMEHVRYVDRAHREIARCLRPHGTYLFTVPYDPTLARTWKLIDPDTEVLLVFPPHMHGDQVRGQIASYRVFGRDFLNELRSCGLPGGFTPITDPAAGVFDGDLFTCHPAPVMPTPRHPDADVTRANELLPTAT